MPELVPGAVIASRYRLERLLGEGGMGSVWAATHALTRGEVALKFLKPEAVHNPQAVRRFMREARAATAVHHPNVVQVHDIFQMEDGLPVMVMDYLVGESFGQRLTRERSLPLGEVASIMVPVISAIGSAHAAGIVHRDLKPDNIFLEKTANGICPKVLDFGIAKLAPQSPGETQSAELTRTGAMLGTPYYMSPEQVFGEKDVDARSDVWAVGVILYEALTGRRPVDGDNLGQLLKVIATGSIAPIHQVAPELPADVALLVDRMLRTDRNDRPSDLHEAFALLSRYTDERAQSFSGVRTPLERSGDRARPSDPSGPAQTSPDTAGGVSTNESVRPASGGRRRAIALVGALGVAVLAVSGTIALTRQPTEQLASAIASESAGVLAQLTPADSAAPEPAAPTSALAPAPSAVADAGADAAASARPAPAGKPKKGTTLPPPSAASAAAPPVAAPPASVPTHSLGGVSTASPY